MNIPLLVLAAALAVSVLFVPFVRRNLVTFWLMKLFKKLKLLPKISETERVALEAGDVWVEREFFSGRPNLKTLMAQDYPLLSEHEKDFLKNQTSRLCQMVNDHDIWERRDLPKQAWDFMKREKFFGMIIPKEYGGLGFSASGHSAVIKMLASRSIGLCVTAMVPNSLGPAELLIHYGTEKQKKYYLPRLATGEEIPCFALTEANAGSDAGALQAEGVVFKGDDEKLYLRLNWQKRFITLAPVATLLGLAFRLRDPMNYLGKGLDVGITCALIPTNAPGVSTGARHNPMDVPFLNGPTTGRDVIVSLDAIIGGPEQAGRGWQMLMECLAAGRGISLPAQASGGMSYVTRAMSAYAKTRKQFGTSIGEFEGIGEMLTEIAGFNYIVEASRIYTLGALDRGLKPPVVTAIMKYFSTELSRKSVIDGMDIYAGAGISKGPKNLLANYYSALPIQITVEGANILTRTLIIFGQGVLRGHPYALKEVAALEAGNLKDFDKYFFKHVFHVVRMFARTTFVALTRGVFVRPWKSGPTAVYQQRLSWASATFSLLTDVLMAQLGAKLKAKGKTTGRMADALGWLYLSTAVLKRYEAEGRRAEDLPLVKWALNHSLRQIQKAFSDTVANLRVPVLKQYLQTLLFLSPLGIKRDDRLDMEISKMIQAASEQRDRLTSGIYIPGADEQFGKLEKAHVYSLEADEVARKIRRATRRGLLKRRAGDWLEEAVRQNVIGHDEYDSIKNAQSWQNQVIQVDEQEAEEFVPMTRRPLPAEAFQRL